MFSDGKKICLMQWQRKHYEPWLQTNVKSCWLQEWGHQLKIWKYLYSQDSMRWIRNVGLFYRPPLMCYFWYTIKSEAVIIQSSTKIFILCCLHCWTRIRFLLLPRYFLRKLHTQFSQWSAIVYKLWSANKYVCVHIFKR